MSEFDEYYNELVENAIKHWKKDKNLVFEGAEKDPVIRLLLSALSYQGFQLKKDIERYQDDITRGLSDKLIPHHMIKPIPAFSILETKIVKNSLESVYELDESAVFEFKNNDKKKYIFTPLLKTNILNTEYTTYIAEEPNTITLKLDAKAGIENISGMSLYIDCGINTTDFDVEVWHYDQCFPLIKPTQYHELPFTKWFNNKHLLLKENRYLFGNYDYWQQVFLLNPTHLYYIDQYDLKEFYFDRKETIHLSIVFKSCSPEFDLEKYNIKINCVPVVNVEKREITLNHNNPIQPLISEVTGEFLNLLYPENDTPENYMNLFSVREYRVEQYGQARLLHQLEDVLMKYVSEYYAFMSIGRLRNSDKMERLHDDLKNIQLAVNEEKEVLPAKYYALLKLQPDLEMQEENVYIEFLTTEGEQADGVPANEAAMTAPAFIDKAETVMLMPSTGGRNIEENVKRKEDIAKYYFLTRDRLVTVTDLRAFCYKELGSNVIEKITIQKMPVKLIVTIKLTEDERINKEEELDSIAAMLQRKIELLSTNMIPVEISII